MRFSSVCLLLFAYKVHPGYRLIVAANRDEFYARPTAPAAFWDDAPHVLAGRDLQAGGTWFGVTKSGRFAAITNYRERKNRTDTPPSRGKLVSDYLTGNVAPDSYLQEIALNGNLYDGFNLIAGDLDALSYYSNREGRVRQLEPGIYAMSNHVLDTPWPKVSAAKSRLNELLSMTDLSSDALFELLRDETRAADETLPDTGFGLEVERMLSPIFIKSEAYGTRSSSVMLIDGENKVSFTERTFTPGSKEVVQAKFDFSIKSERYVS